MDESTAPRFIKCPVCDGEDTLNVNANVEHLAVDLCERCHTDIHSDERDNFDEPCRFGCGKKFCYCEEREQWKKKLACAHEFVERKDPGFERYIVRDCPKCNHYVMEKRSRRS